MKMCMQRKSTRQRGFVEISLNMVLVVMAIMGGAALIIGMKMVGDAKAEALFSGHRQIVDTLRLRYRNATGFA